ncbi:hypothetical protein BGZ51_003564 [Haplosporangium sp. Z 767]|nr:hypothetical protein BGZ51_003564 [Haplosporangium sp. Z 767]
MSVHLVIHLLHSKSIRTHTLYISTMTSVILNTQDIQQMAHPRLLMNAHHSNIHLSNNMDTVQTRSTCFKGQMDIVLRIHSEEEDHSHIQFIPPGSDTVNRNGLSSPIGNGAAEIHSESRRSLSLERRKRGRKPKQKPGAECVSSADAHLMNTVPAQGSSAGQDPTIAADVLSDQQASGKRIERKLKTEQDLEMNKMVAVLRPWNVLTPETLLENQRQESITPQPTEAKERMKVMGEHARSASRQDHLSTYGPMADTDRPPAENVVGQDRRFAGGNAVAQQKRGMEHHRQLSDQAFTPYSQGSSKEIEYHQHLQQRQHQREHSQPPHGYGPEYHDPRRQGPSQPTQVSEKDTQQTKPSAVPGRGTETIRHLEATVASALVNIQHENRFQSPDGPTSNPDGTESYNQGRMEAPPHPSTSFPDNPHRPPRREEDLRQRAVARDPQSPQSAVSGRANLDQDEEETAFILQRMMNHRQNVQQGTERPEHDDTKLHQQHPSQQHPSHQHPPPHARHHTGPRSGSPSAPGSVAPEQRGSYQPSGQQNPGYGQQGERPPVESRQIESSQRPQPHQQHQQHPLVPHHTAPPPPQYARSQGFVRPEASMPDPHHVTANDDHPARLRHLNSGGPPMEQAYHQQHGPHGFNEHVTEEQNRFRNPIVYPPGLSPETDRWRTESPTHGRREVFEAPFHGQPPPHLPQSQPPQQMNLQHQQQQQQQRQQYLLSHPSPYPHTHHRGSASGSWPENPSAGNQGRAPHVQQQTQQQQQQQDVEMESSAQSVAAPLLQGQGQREAVSTAIAAAAADVASTKLKGRGKGRSKNVLKDATGSEKPEGGQITSQAYNGSVEQQSMDMTGEAVGKPSSRGKAKSKAPLRSSAAEIDNRGSGSNNTNAPVEMHAGIDPSERKPANSSSNIIMAPGLAIMTPGQHHENIKAPESLLFGSGMILVKKLPDASPGPNQGQDPSTFLSPTAPEGLSVDTSGLTTADLDSASGPAQSRTTTPSSGPALTIYSVKKRKSRLLVDPETNQDTDSPSPPPPPPAPAPAPIKKGRGRKTPASTEDIERSNEITRSPGPAWMMFGINNSTPSTSASGGNVDNRPLAENDKRKRKKIKIKDLDVRQVQRSSSSSSLVVGSSDTNKGGEQGLEGEDELLREDDEEEQGNSGRGSKGDLEPSALKRRLPESDNEDQGNGNGGSATKSARSGRGRGPGGTKLKYNKRKSGSNGAGNSSNSNDKNSNNHTSSMVTGKSAISSDESTGSGRPSSQAGRSGQKNGKGHKTAKKSKGDRSVATPTGDSEADIDYLPMEDDINCPHMFGIDETDKERYSSSESEEEDELEDDDDGKDTSGGKSGGGLALAKDVGDGAAFNVDEIVIDPNDPLQIQGREWVTRLKMPDAAWDEAYRTYEKVKRLKELKNRQPVRKRDAILAAILYIVCRNQNSPRTFSEICTASGVKRGDIGSYYRLMLKVLEPNLNATATARDTDAEAFMTRWCESLSLPSIFCRSAVHVFNLANTLNLTSGKCPSSVGAAAIYLCIFSWNDARRLAICQLHNCRGCACAGYITHPGTDQDEGWIRKEQKDVATAVGVVSATLMGCFRSLAPEKERLIPDEFLKAAVKDILQAQHSQHERQEAGQLQSQQMQLQIYHQAPQSLSQQQ